MFRLKALALSGEVMPVDVLGKEPELDSVYLVRGRDGLLCLSSPPLINNQ